MIPNCVYFYFLFFWRKFRSYKSVWSTRLEGWLIFLWTMCHVVLSSCPQTKCRAGQTAPGMHKAHQGAWREDRWSACWWTHQEGAGGQVLCFGEADLSAAGKPLLQDHHIISIINDCGHNQVCTWKQFYSSYFNVVSVTDYGVYKFSLGLSHLSLTLYCYWKLNCIEITDPRAGQECSLTIMELQGKCFLATAGMCACPSISPLQLCVPGCNRAGTEHHSIYNTCVYVHHFIMHSKVTLHNHFFLECCGCEAFLVMWSKWVSASLPSSV